MDKLLLKCEKYVIPLYEQAIRISFISGYALDNGADVEGASGCVVFYEDESPLIYIEPDNEDLAGTIAHEAFHVADHYRKYLGLTLDDEGSESIAWIVGDIAQAIVNSYRRYKKAKGE